LAGRSIPCEVSFIIASALTGFGQGRHIASIDLDAPAAVPIQIRGLGIDKNRSRSRRTKP
jgi:hypothetical protein